VPAAGDDNGLAVESPAPRINGYDRLVGSLPDELRSFDSWRYPGGLFAYMSALSDLIGGDRRVGPVMHGAGISVADCVSASPKRTHLSDL